VVNVTQAEYQSYPVGPPVDAMLLLSANFIISPSSPYALGQNITSGFTVKNVGYEPISLSNLGTAGRFNGGTFNDLPYDLPFVSQALNAGASYSFTSQSKPLVYTGTYDFFAAYQENNGHWALSIPAVLGVIRAKQISVSPQSTTHTITVEALPREGGIVNGSGSFTAGSSRTVTAMQTMVIPLSTGRKMVASLVPLQVITLRLIAIVT
jgi:hypothetical protein